MEVLIMSLMFYRGLTAGSRGWFKCEYSMPGSSSFLSARVWVSNYWSGCGYHCCRVLSRPEGVCGRVDAMTRQQAKGGVNITS